MGVNHNVYVGAYLRITEPVTVTRIDRCAGHDRGGYIFCPVCGYETHDRMIIKTDAPSADGFWDHDDWIDDLALVSCDDVLTTRTTIAISNSTDCGAGFDVTDMGAGAWKVPDMTTSKANLVNSHHRDIGRLEELGCTVNGRVWDPRVGLLTGMRRPLAR